VIVPKRFVSLSTSIIGSAIKKNQEWRKVDRLVPQADGSGPVTTRWGQRVPPFSCFPVFLIGFFTSSFHIWKIDVRRHSGA
jgi:hypothetical protein